MFPACSITGSEITTFEGLCYEYTCIKEGSSRAVYVFKIQLQTTSSLSFILGDPGAASRDDGIFMGESLQQERESPWALTLTERIPEAFEIPPSDWPEKYFSGQSA